MITITGTNFGSSQGTSTVTFNGAATAPSNWSDTTISVPVPAAATTGSVLVTVNGLSSNGVTFTVTQGGVTGTGTMTAARFDATATVLDDATVLLVGGTDSNNATLSSAEIYNPATGVFAVTAGGLLTGRSSHTATLLNDGTVLIAGGADASGNWLQSAEIYKPSNGTFTAVNAKMNTGRCFHTATLLNDGTVLLAGGPVSNANIYDPVQRTFTLTGNMNTRWMGHTATLLNDGTVLVVGGLDMNGNVLASADLYDPVTKTFHTLTAGLNTGRAWHTANLLNNGKVLIAGGSSDSDYALNSAEIYDPVTQTFSTTGNLATGRGSQAATLINNGAVLIAGGWDVNSNVLTSLELFDPTAGTFTGVANLAAPRGGAAQALLTNGNVLVAGGMDNSGNALNIAELYQPSTFTPPGLVVITVGPSSPSVPAGSFQHFTATGTFSDNSTYTLKSVSWSSGNATVAIVSSDATNSGNAAALTRGTSEIRACAGSVCGSTTLTSTVQTPGITSLSPTSGPVGTAVTITGANFGSTQGTSTVTFNGVAANVTSWGASSIVVQVPQGASTGDVVVTVYEVASNAVPFTVLSVPNISSLTPTVGSAGTVVTITGSNFGTTPASGTVTFNWAPAAATAWTDTAITVPVPLNATSGSVVVTVLGVPSNSVPFSVVGGPTYAATGNNMRNGHWGGTATLLTTGAVLVAGGYDTSSTVTGTADLYAPTAQTFTFTGDLNFARAGHTATLLNNGQVLMVGGTDSSAPLASAELYDPVSGNFTPAGSMSTPRFNHTATLLTDGRVLIVGGMDGNYNVLSSAEVYDPALGTFAPAGNLVNARYRHTATLLNDGTVLFTGGYGSSSILASAEIYAGGAFTAVGSMNTARQNHTATLLNGGKVLIVGGAGINNSPLMNVELFDSLAGQFVPSGNLHTARQGHAATLLNNGTVLIAGGSGANNSPLTSTELYDPTTGALFPTASLAAARQQPTATLLSNGSVLVAGGRGSLFLPLASAELYQPSTLTPPGLVSVALSPANPSVVAGASRRLTATGTFSDNSTQVLASATWALSASSVATVTSDATNYGSVLGITGSQQATVSACLGSVCGSTTINVGYATTPAQILGLTPQSGTVGTGVLISGTNFGATQGSSSVTFNGIPATSYGGWSDSAINVAVPAGATTGNVVVTVHGEPSNGVPFTLTVAVPSITGLTPSQGSPGRMVTINGANFGATPGIVTFNGTAAPIATWTDTTITTSVPAATTGNVVVTVGGVASNGVLFTIDIPPTIVASSSPAPGAGGWNNSPVTVSFTCTAGSSRTINCPSPQTISTEGESQVVSGTVTDLIGNTATASVTLNIDMTPPTITVASPADSASVSDAGVTVTGSVGDSLSGATQVTCGGVTGALADSAFSCNMTLSAGNNLIVIKATDAAGNVSASRLHLTLTGRWAPANSLTITPNGYTMLIGETTQFTAVDELGNPRPDATWTVSDSTVATITTDSSPSLTAIAAGQVTLTATVGSSTAQTTITVSGGASLPPGTLRWSAPAPAGYAVRQIVQAQATWSTPDLYAIAEGTGSCAVTGLTAAGQLLWQAQLANSSGLACGGTPDNSGGLILYLGSHIVDLDGQTGAQIWRTDFDEGTLIYPGAVGQDGTIYLLGTLDQKWGLISLSADTGIAKLLYSPAPDAYGYDNISTPVVDSDGSILAAVYLEYRYTGNQTLSLLRIGPDGAVTLTPFKSDDGSNGEYYSWLNVIPDGQGGALVAYSSQLPHRAQYYISHVTASGSTDINVPAYPNAMVLGDNRMAYASAGSSIVGFNLDSDSTVWTYQAPSDFIGMSIIAATDGGGLVAALVDQYGVDTAVRFDANGQPTTDSWSAHGIDYFVGDLWTGVTTSGQANVYSAQTVPFSSTSWFMPDGAGENAAVQNLDVGQTASQSDPNQTVILDAFNRLLTAFSADNGADRYACSTWLQGTGEKTAVQQIQFLINGDYFGHATFNDPSTSAVTTGQYNLAGGRTGIPDTYSIAVNDGGSFFNAAGPGGGAWEIGPHMYGGNTQVGQNFILTHELAHWMQFASNNQAAPLFIHDGGCKKCVKHNDLMVNLYCRYIIEGLTVTPGSLAFGQQQQFTTSAAQTVTLGGDLVDLRISSITIDGPDAVDFAQTTTCGNRLATGQTCTISVTFTPLDIGPLSATMKILDSAGDSAQVVSLTATGRF